MMSLNRNNKMKKILKITFCIILASVASVYAQTAGDYFNRAANEYIYQNDQIALNTIDNGLKTYPNDPPLVNLKEKILKDKEEQEQKDQQQNQDQQDQKDQQEQEQKEQEQQEQQQEEQQQQQDQQESEEGEDAEQKEQPQQQPEQQETDEEGEEMQEPPRSREEKLEELNLTEEKARMILEAMKNNEIQYIQQNKRKPTKKPDSSKPDW